MSSHSSPNQKEGLPVSTFGWMVGGFVIAALLVVMGAMAYFEPEALKLGLLRVFAAFMSPFLLEFLLFIIFLSSVVLLNWWRRRRDGSEWVYLEEDHSGEDSGQPAGLHDAVFAAPPEDVDADQTRWAEIDGLIEMGAFDEAAAEIAAMPEHAVNSDRGLESRIALAQATGKADLAAKLQVQLES
ncbi:hypothetical protein [Sulfuriroseicoccus oceanibius]|uniref:Uncharacterized protein n=1 Tax=Sulfuriroseicoccus oceanibius TaxID=2707525 RepID=A0A6B3L8Y1_9BACT|nr:hypothetical protein [Sulfuriroseicoccus oceanibius]QQL44836.1 hypothetical protein G3M56_013305 [Sulfuriroseicoccus oceanibius]